MLGILIILIAMGIGFVAGYGVREMISQKRRRLARGEQPKAQPQRSEAVVAPTGPEDAINLERLLVAANDDLSSRRRQQAVDHNRQPDQFDGAVRDLLGELNRRPSGAPSLPREVRPGPIGGAQRTDR
ncbi:hypothetical protein IC762_28105 [Bradyrhizobium genosp. L]|uniref:hypothetical protein n=1 Tax=Bradyrhizobium genosp. L TaxID=83637 RepID=UPI0018A293A6|nr:hypothetical protein [Bradyrhizobium genosp. L]QPF83537.1 hypothetical protein IC762_28105 [Bradyrhizobium genosp. L]